MEQTTDSLKKTARLAGFLYFIMGLPAFYGIMYVPKQIIVRGDAAATANNILGNELLFRTGIAGHLISLILFLWLAFVLYKLFKHVNEHYAKLMVALVIVQVPIVFLIETFRITSLLLLKGEVLKALEPENIQNLAFLFLKVHGYGIMTLEIFMGLWLLPFGQLVYKSGFIPRIFGILLIIAGIGYTIDSFTFILLPNYRAFTQPPAFTLSGIGELSIILWLLIKGVKVQKTQSHPVSYLQNI